MSYWERRFRQRGCGRAGDVAAYFGYDIDLLGKAIAGTIPTQLSQVQREAQRHYDELLQRFGQPVSLMAPEFRERSVQMIRLRTLKAFSTSTATHEEFPVRFQSGPRAR
jgi:hypothetical protein